MFILYICVGVIAYTASTVAVATATVYLCPLCSGYVSILII